MTIPTSVHPIPEDHGDIFEKRTQEFLEKLFLADFVIANPKVQFGSGKEEELADILVPFQDTLYCFQLKSKIQTKKPEELTDVHFGRIQRVIDDGIRQVKTTIRALDQKVIGRVKNLHGIPLPINWNGIKKVVGIVLVNLAGEEQYTYAERSRIVGGISEINGSPVHIFMGDDFAHIWQWNDTISDMHNYLEMREAAKKAGVFIEPIGEPDFLYFFKFRQPDLKEIIAGNVASAWVEPGLLAEATKKHADIISSRNREFKVSYLIDSIIGEMHKTIGFKIWHEEPHPAGEQSEHETSDMTDEEKYFQLLLPMIGTCRLRRKLLAHKMPEKLDRACTQPYSYFISGIDDAAEIGLLFVSTGLPRLERIRLLSNISMAALHQTPFKKILGIATDPGHATLRSHDFLFLDNMDFSTLTDEDRKIIEAPLFSSIKRQKGIDEWQIARGDPTVDNYFKSRPSSQ